MNIGPPKPYWRQETPSLLRTAGTVGIPECLLRTRVCPAKKIGKKTRRTPVAPPLVVLATDTQYDFNKIEIHAEDVVD